MDPIREEDKGRGGWKVSRRIGKLFQSGMDGGKCEIIVISEDRSCWRLRLVWALTPEGYVM